MRSDYKLISFNIPSTLRTSKSKVTQIYNFSKGNYEQMNEYIYFSDFSNFTDIEYLWSFLRTCLEVCYTKFIPKIKSSTARYPKWFTGDIIKKKNQTKFLQQHQLRPTVTSALRLISIAGNLHKSISTARSQFQSQLVQNFSFKNSTPIFNYIRSSTKQSTLSPVMFLDSKQETTDPGKAEIFNEFFQSIFTSDNNPVS